MLHVERLLVLLLAVGCGGGGPDRDAGSGGDDAGAAPIMTTATVALDCTSGASACTSPATCVELDTFTGESVCYVSARGRCGAGNCHCPDGTACWFPAMYIGPTDGMCVTPDEAARDPAAQRVDACP